MGLSWLAAEPTDILHAGGEGLQLKVIFRFSKTRLLEKVKIEINSERALMGLHKSLPYTFFFFPHRARKSKRGKICFYAGRWEESMELAFLTFKVLYLAQHQGLGQGPFP